MWLVSVNLADKSRAYFLGENNMPKTKNQKILFSILMSFTMVYGMEVYNNAIINKGIKPFDILRLFFPAGSCYPSSF